MQGQQISILDCLKMFRDGWDRFWFEKSDPTALCVMRWFVGGMLVYTHFVWGLALDEFFGAKGFNNPDVLQEVVNPQLILPSFWWSVPDANLFQVHCACMVVLVLFWIGFATRITSVLSMVITVSYAYRAHMANFGLDQINAMLCLYLCVGPSGAVLSVDRLIRRRWAKLRGHSKPEVALSESATIARRLIQLHFCVIYTFAGLSKLQGDAWWNGQAVWLAFANLEYQSMNMTWVAWYPWISDLMTHTTIAWEVSFFALIWINRLRPFMLFVGFLLHLGIGAAMGMWTFGLIMIFGHICFWPDAWVHAFVAKFTRRKSKQTTAAALELKPSASFATLLAPVAFLLCGCAEAIDSPLEFAELARHHERNGDEQAAIAAYKKSFELREDDAPLWWDFGRAYERVEELENAEMCYSRAIEFEPQLVSAYERRGIVRMELGKREDAIADFSKALEIQPDHAGSLHQRGLAYEELGDVNHAILDLDASLRIDGLNASAYVSRGSLYSAVGRHPRALEDFHHALSVDEELAAAWVGQAKVHAAMGNQDAAQHCRQRAVETGATADELAGLDGQQGPVEMAPAIGRRYENVEISAAPIPRTEESAGIEPEMASFPVEMAPQAAE